MNNIKRLQQEHVRNKWLIPTNNNINITLLAKKYGIES